MKAAGGGHLGIGCGILLFLPMRCHATLFMLVFGTACAAAPARPKPPVTDLSPPSRSTGASDRRSMRESFNFAVTEAIVGDVVKGDELTLQDGTEVRLIGVKSPIAAVSQRQGNYYGKGALELTRQLVEWKRVRLEFDKQTHDPKGRLLAYVYTPEGKLLQEELLRAGHAFASAFPPNVRYHTRFQALQHEAMQAKRGMWGLRVDDYPREHRVEHYRIEGVTAEVVNGDSIRLDDGTIVRYIGIDAPDSENRKIPGEVGYAAFMANRRWIEGKTLVIEYDVEPKDPHGRDLAYVFVEGKLVNAELVREGHAIVAVFPPNTKYLDWLIAAQDEAAQAKRGLWSGLEQ